MWSAVRGWTLLRGFIAPVLVLGMIWWAISSALEVGPLWAGVVVAIAGVIILWDLFRERVDTGRQCMEIDLLRERLDAAEAHAIHDAEEE